MAIEFIKINNVMIMHPLKNIFNKVLWDKKERKEDYEVIFIHRGAPEDRKTISFGSIKKASKSTFIYDYEGGETTIPFHRIVIIRNVYTGDIIWKKD